MGEFHLIAVCKHDLSILNSDAMTSASDESEDSSFSISALPNILALPVMRSQEELDSVSLVFEDDRDTFSLISLFASEWPS